MSKKIKVQDLKTRAFFRPESFNEDKRTVDVIFAEGAKGKRFSWSIGDFYEELSMKKGHVRLDRLNKGAPVLDNHERFMGLRGIIGVVEKAWIESGQGVATIRFSEREEVQGIINDIKSGVIRNVSVGYKVHEFKDVSKKKDEIPTLRAVDWEPYEVSFVDIPFDMNAQARSQNVNQYECTIQENEESQMDRAAKIKAACEKAGLSEEIAQEIISREFDIEDLDSVIAKEVESRSQEPTEEPTEESTEEPTDEPSENDGESAGEPTEEPANEPTEEPTEEPQPVDQEALRKEGEDRERERVGQIEMAARALGIDAKEYISKNLSADETRKIMIQAKAEADAQNPTNNHNMEARTVDKKQLRKKGAEQALLNRYDSAKYQISEESKEFRHATLIDLARNFLNAEGVNTMGLSPNEIAERAFHTTSDFKEILANVANKSLRNEYNEGPQTFGFMTRSITVNDFKEISRPQLGDAPVLEKVNEKGEFESGTISESAEKYSLKTYGKIVGITRQTLVNDDLNAFTRIPGMFGRRARDLESELIWNILGVNPTMADGNALFSAAHGNLAGAGAAIGVSTVAAGREAMRLQTGLDGLLIDIIPKHLIVPVALETAAEQFLGSTVPQLDSNVNPFKGKLSPVAEPRLDKYSKTAWYLAASTSQIDMIEIARLAGEEGPMLSTKEGFEIDGMKIKIRYDFAAKVLDWRGFYKNAGA